MITIEGKSITYSVKINDASLWYTFSGGYSKDVKRTGECWYHLTMSRHSFEGHGKSSFSPEDREALLALETDYYHFHWFDQKKEDRRMKNSEARYRREMKKMGYKI